MSLNYLLGRLSLVEQRVRQAVSERRVTDPAPDDPFRGLYLSDEAVDAILETARSPYHWQPDTVAIEAAADEAERRGETLRLRRLARDAGLGAIDIDLILIAMAAELDSRFEPLYGYLHDDVTRRRPSIGLALRLCGRSEADPVARQRLAPHAPLVRTGLIAVEEADRSWLTRLVSVPDRVGAHLLGDDTPDALALGAMDLDIGAIPDREAAERAGPVQALSELLMTGTHLAYLRQRSGGAAVDVASATLQAIGREVVALDVDRLAKEPEKPALVKAVMLEALLRHGGLVIGPVDSFGDTPPAVIRMLANAAVPLLFYGTVTWEPRWCDEIPVQVSVEMMPRSARAAVWQHALNGTMPEGVDAGGATAHFRLGANQIRRAARAASAQARLAGEQLTSSHLRHGARSVNAGGLERLARRIEPGVGFDDLVLQDHVVRQLQELCSRARLRDRVLDEWRMRPGGGRGHGVTGLFAGDSGTGKTMSAEVIAGELGLDLYTVNLATVVDKYVGETEKNLERIFTEASGVNGVLLFDEADAIFGKRSEVRDAHDRYANIESAYLLQRMETFDGLAILATNLRANLDDAFTRRLDMIIDFPTPDPLQRQLLWDRCLGDRIPRAEDLDLDYCAESFEMSGGNIRSAVVGAAYLAAEAERPLQMSDLIGAIAREYRKMGRLCLEREFGPYMALL